MFVERNLRVECEIEGQANSVMKLAPEVKTQDKTKNQSSGKTSDNANERKHPFPKVEDIVDRLTDRVETRRSGLQATA